MLFILDSDSFPWVGFWPRTQDISRGSQEEAVGKQTEEEEAAEEAKTSAWLPEKGATPWSGPFLFALLRGPLEDPSTEREIPPAGSQQLPENHGPRQRKEVLCVRVRVCVSLGTLELSVGEKRVFFLFYLDP